MFKKILFSIQFFNLWLKKPLEMTNLLSKCTKDSISLKWYKGANPAPSPKYFYN